MATYGYLRVSTTEQVDGSSLDDQRRKITGLAMAADMSVDRFFEDGGVSGSIALADRPAGEELVKLLAPGDSLIVAKLDRLFRSAADALATAEAFKKRGVNLYMLDMGTEAVTANGASRMFFGMLALVAEFERTRIKERLADGRKGKASKGGHIGGDAPFGWRVEGTGKAAVLVPIAEQQAALETMREGKTAGLSLRKIAELVGQRHALKVSHMAVAAALARSGV